MTITLLTPQGSLASRYTPLQFSADEPVVSVAVELTPEVGPSARETVYDGTDADNENGTFSYQYRDSVQDGDLWTIHREGGWPCDAQIRIKPVTTVSGGISPPLAALQPTLYSPVAQYALQGAPDTARLYLDRSGNNNHLTAGNADAVPDLISGQTAIRPISQTQAGRLKAVGRAALAITGALTFTCRLRRTGGGTGTLAVQSGIFGAGNTQNTLYTLSIVGSGQIYYFWEKTAGNSQDVTSSIGSPMDEWVFLSFRRTPSGTPTFGINGAYETPPGTFVGPSGGSNSFLTIGDHDEVGVGGQLNGWISDVSIWDVRLTDAELIPLRAAAMGL